MLEKPAERFLFWRLEINTVTAVYVFGQQMASAVSAAGRYHPDVVYPSVKVYSEASTFRQFACGPQTKSCHFDQTAEVPDLRKTL